MNFKYTDDAFLQELMKVNAFLKGAQVPAQQELPPNPYVDENLRDALAKKLVNQLEQGLTLSKDPNNSGAGELYLNDLQNLNSLIDFLSREGLQYAGKYIVSRPATSNSPLVMTEAVNPDPKLYVEYNLDTAVGDMPHNNKVFVYRDGLINYLQSLQKQATQEPNELLAAIVGRLIGSANKDLKLNMSSSPEKKPDANMFRDDQSLDTLLDTMIFESPLLPARNQGSITVTPAILKNKGAFDDFAKTIKLKKQDKIISYDQFNDSNYCDLLYILWSRANSYNFRRGEAIDKHYLDLVVSLANQYQCNLQEVHHESSANKPVQQIAWKIGEPLTPQMKQMLAAISIRYPLRRDLIDFNGIKEWVGTYQRIMNQIGVAMDPNSTTASELSDSIIRDYGKMSQSLTVPAIIIYREIRAKAIATQKSPQEAIHIPMNYVQMISRMLTALIDVLQSFKLNFHDSMPEEWQAELDKQIDDSASSLAALNIRQAQQWIATMPAAMAQAERGM